MKDRPILCSTTSARGGKMNKIILRTGRKKHFLLTLFCIVIFSFISGNASEAVPVQQKSFPSPEEAVKSLVGAVRTGDTEEMLAVLGAGSRELIHSGDEVADSAAREKFLRAYDEMNTLFQESPDRTILVIGTDKWPMPIPIVNRGTEWVFDVEEGQQEILNRRIGRNELHVIDVLHAYVEAQLEYAGRNCSGSGMVEFARKLISTEGKRDGLYWPANEGEDESPFGPLVAQAAKEGYAEADLSPFHGYYFKVLKGQGSHADGGSYNYVVRDRMILGFALVTYPAEYGNSGIMTFIVNQAGVIYQKDLGKNTRNIAEAMEIFDPDETWEKVE
jgi:hypothetical protein